MQRRGLEWAFRLGMEPRRLWRRYARAVPIFVFLLTRQYLAARLSH
jgi:N-acetylglucosaminyldiphosphoundecaprenol N-acetyl-beta-D-mannosaminyltransferase